MLVTSLSPSETVHWFEQDDRQHEILCCLITASPEHREVLKKAVLSCVDADAALGRRVCFLLSGDTPPTDFEDLGFRQQARVFIPGQVIRSAVVPLWSFSDSPEWREGSGPSPEEPLWGYQLERLADKTVAVADEWMTLLEVQRKALPVLCVLVKGSDPIIISLGSSFTLSDLLEVFGNLADIAQRQSSTIVRLTLDAEHRIRRGAELEASYHEVQERLKAQLEAVCNRFQVARDQRARFVQFLAARNYSDQALEKLFRECGLIEVDGFNSNSTVRGARNKIMQLARIAEDYEQNRPKEQDCVSLSEALADFRIRQAETADLVRKLRSRGIEVKGMDKSKLGVLYDLVVDRVEKAASLIEKLVELAKVASPMLS